MKHLNNFGEFITEGLSKNHPIQELRQADKLGIILLGAPGAGKSTFAKNVILPHNRNIKTFSTDDVSLMYTKDPNVYKVGAAELNVERLKKYIQSGQNFIYDTTGANEKSVYDISKQAKKLGYNLIFILILVDLPTAKSQNLKRSLAGGHNVDQDYIDFVYQTQNQTTKGYMRYLKPESFYIVLNRGDKYKYYKHLGDKLLKRKVDKYVPMSESKEEELLSDLKNLHHKMRGFIRTGTPDEVYEDYFLDLKESENFKVSISKGNGFVTNIELNGLIDLDSAESEFNRLLSMMKTAKQRFDCHFMIWIGGQPQQDLNPNTHRNDLYNFKGVGSYKSGYDKDFYYTDRQISAWETKSRPFPEDKAPIQIKFMIV